MMLRRFSQFFPRLGSFAARRAIATGSQEKLTLPRLPIFEALNSHPRSKTAIVHSKSGKSFTYGDLLVDTALYKDRLLKLSRAKEEDLREGRIAFLVENGYDYVGTLSHVFVEWKRF